MSMDSGEYSKSQDFENKTLLSRVSNVLQNTTALIEQISKQFRDGYEKLLTMMENNEKTKNLAFKLDFNEYYKYHRMQKRSKLGFKSFIDNQNHYQAGGGGMDIENPNNNNSGNGHF